MFQLVSLSKSCKESSNWPFSTASSVGSPEGTHVVNQPAAAQGSALRAPSCKGCGASTTHWFLFGGGLNLIDITMILPWYYNDITWLHYEKNVCSVVLYFGSGQWFLNFSPVHKGCTGKHVQWWLWSRDTFPQSPRRLAETCWETSIVAFEQVNPLFWILPFYILFYQVADLDPLCILFYNLRNPWLFRSTCCCRGWQMLTLYWSVIWSNPFLYPSRWGGWQNFYHVACSYVMCRLCHV